jgi:hypothetical protein
MSQLQGVTFDTIGGLAFLFQVVKVVPQWPDAVFRRKIHESGHGHLAKLRRPSKRNLILAIEFKSYLYVYGFHKSKLEHSLQSALSLSEDHADA